MKRNKIIRYVSITFVGFIFTACIGPGFVKKTENKTVPESYKTSKDTINVAKTRWNDFFTDQNLRALIDTALNNNQELNMMLQETRVARNEVRVRKGAYLPFIGLRGAAGVDKTARYTSKGANDATTDIEPGKAMPDPLQDYLLGAYASWEVDVWRKLRNSKRSAIQKYLSTVEGKNFMVTNLIAEVANSYYELMALDNQLEILRSNIKIQQNALDIVIMEKNAAKVTELAVRKFEAEVFKNQSRQYYIMQKITETENKINFLVGRTPQPVARDSQNFTDFVLDTIQAGIPSQLLENRPDVRQAEKNLEAAKLDVKVAKAEFYPSLMIRAGVGLQAFNPSHLIKTPASLVYSLAGDLVAPLINRNAIKANYNSANAKQVQAVYNYERTILNAYIEVVNQLSNINNLGKSYNLQEKQVQALTQSINISTSLFQSARANYMEVLLTQRDALESKFELIETKRLQMSAKVNIYKSLGGGWN